jgi:hypothetical protein
MPGPYSTPRRRASAAHALAISHVRHSSHQQRLARSAAARAALAARFTTAVDPDNRLRESERNKRAHLLRRAWMAHLNYARVMGRKPLTLTAFVERYAPPPPVPEEAER